MTGPAMPTRPPASTVRPQTPADQERASAVVGRRRAPKPVFVDRSGRRRRIFVATGVAAAVVVVLALVSLVGGLFGSSPLPLPGLPDLVNPAPHPAPDTTIRDAGSTNGPSGASAGAASAPGQSTSGPTQRHVPTQTPTDHGRPTKT